MKFLRDWIEELQVKLRNEERHTDFLTHDLEKVRARLGDRSRACNELAASRDAVAATLNETQAELDALRGRWQREVSPHIPLGAESPVFVSGDATALVDAQKEINRLKGLVKAGDEFIKLVRERVGLTGDLDGTESALERLDKLNADCGRYRKEIRELRLTRQRYDDFGFGKAAEFVSPTLEGAQPRYEACNVLSDGKAVGYGAWDHLRKEWYESWYATELRTLDDCQREAITTVEKLNRSDALAEEVA